jgi:hypothetical protein
VTCRFRMPRRVRGPGKRIPTMMVALSTVLAAASGSAAELTRDQVLAVIRTAEGQRPDLSKRDLSDANLDGARGIAAAARGASAARPE